MSLIEDLKNTRRILEERGRCVGNLEIFDGRVCLDGAIALACTGQAKYFALTKNESAAAVVDAIYEQVKDHVLSYRGGRTIADSVGIYHNDAHGRSNGVWMYNDDTGITDQDVYDVVDRAIGVAVKKETANESTAS